MSKRPVDPRLFARPELSRQPESQAEQRDHLFRMLRRAAADAPAANRERCLKYASAILVEADASDEVKELARSLLERLQLVERLIEGGASETAINEGMLLGAKFEAMRLSRIFGKAIDDVRRRNAVHESQKVSADKSQRIEAWWVANRGSYRSDNAARQACAAAVGGLPRTVRTVVSKAKAAGRL